MDQICKFTSQEVFVESLPKEEFLIESLRQSIMMYHQEIEKLIRLALSMFAEGFALPTGSLFCFGPHTDDDDITVLEIHKANTEILENLDKNVDVKNIGEKRNIGSFNYASTVRSSS